MRSVAIQDTVKRFNLRLVLASLHEQVEWLSTLACYCQWRCQPWTLLLCKLTIGFVSAYDIFLTIKYVQFLPLMEMNPVGRWMMALDSGPSCQLEQIACFVAAKFVGNFITLAIIELLGAWRQQLATSVALTIAFFQILLLYYLTTA